MAASRLVRLGALAVLAASASGPAAQPSPEAVANLEAFARLYGAVRFFHPADEAADTDWDRLAVLGAQRALDAETPESLADTLRGVFAPVAPSLAVFAAGEAPPPLDADSAGFVAWQHLGVALPGGPPNVYRSVRPGRRAPVRGQGFGAFVQAVDAVPLRGRRVRLSAAVRAEAGSGQLWLRVDRAGGEMGAFDNMDDRPVTSPEWARYTVEAHVDPDAEGIALGGIVAGVGTAEFDAVRLEVEGEDGQWSEVPLGNGSFDDAETPDGWGTGGPGYDYAVVGGTEGAGALRVENEWETASPLFRERVGPGQAAAIDLGRGLRARVPLALASRDGRTVPAPDPSALADLRAALAAVDPAASDAAGRAADVVAAWTVFEHFYPYFDAVDVDWDAALTEALRDALAAETDAAHCRTLRQLVARLGDGHGYVACAGRPAWALPPFIVERIEGRVVVVGTADSSLARPGDAVVSVDGSDAGAVLDSLAALHSGSPHWRLRRAYGEFGAGPPDTAAQVVLERDGRRLTAEAPRRSGLPPSERRPDPVAEVRPGVFYVDVARATDSLFAARLDEIAAAEGVVFDVRGYPQMSPAFLAHLTDRPVVSALWEVPKTIRPGRPAGAGYDTTRWAPIEPDAPRVRGRVAFLTDERAISYAESVMGIVDHFELGTTVGGPTAGANGNVNPFVLPGRHRVAWTGMRVRRHDGSRLHGVGVAPDVPVQRTRAGVQAGRDEVLERGVEVVTGRH
jgi:C-terminal processing protease CtpA/Prc